ncbi:MAG TPA: ABC transporter permease [Verrucomicrobiae bacterium]|nr:ABC transporter permease [Verrucomicrobiae bacterium]
MAGYAARRLLLALPTLLGVSLLSFLILSVLPGDPIAARLEGGAPLSAEAEARLRAELRLDRPVIARYADWLAGAARGDLGRSLRDGRPVAGIVGDALPWTILLNAAAVAALYSVALPLGLAQARRPRSPAARLAGAGLVAVSVIPPFVAALVLQGLVSVRLGWLPLEGTGRDALPPGGGAATLLLPASLLSVLAHLVLPALCLALAGWGFAARYARDAFAQALPGAEVAAARARGLRGTALLRHFAPALALPLVWLLGGLIPSLLAGSVVVEEAFSWPGVGRVMVQAVLGRDTPVAMALLLLSGTAVLAAQLLVDLIYPALDPRLRERLPDRTRAAGATDRMRPAGGPA